MSDQVFLEIIVPAYNEEDNIEQCLQSILNQEISREFRVLVVDDGSTDRTADIIKVYDDKNNHIRVKHHDPNRGYGATIQSGLESSNAEVVLFIDGDSIIEPGSIEAIIQHYENGADAVFGYVDVKNDHRLHGLYCKVGKHHNEDARYGGACMSFRKEVLEELGGFLAVENRGGHDVEIKHRVQKNDYEVFFEDDARVYSRFPEGWKTVLRQKFRAGKTHVIHMNEHPEKFDPRILIKSSFYGTLGAVAIGSLVYFPLTIFLIGLLVIFLYEHGPTAFEMYKASGSIRLGLLYLPYALASGYLRSAGYLSELGKLVDLLRGYSLP